MRFVPIKTIEQQGKLFVHRAHQGYVAERTALINRIRGLLSEVGIVLPQAFKAFHRGVHEALEDLPGYCNQVIGELMNELSHIQERIAQSERQIQLMARQDEQAQRLMQLSGVGPATASAIVASIGNGHDFKNGRQFSAWLGLVPRQNSSGGKVKLSSITKAGDNFLRTLLVLGARSVLMNAHPTLTSLGKAGESRMLSCVSRPRCKPITQRPSSATFTPLVIPTLAI